MRAGEMKSVPMEAIEDGGGEGLAENGGGRKEEGDADKIRRQSDALASILRSRLPPVQRRTSRA
jgi:hypothetical protein